MVRHQTFAARLLAVPLGLGLVGSVGCLVHKKYENPISKNTSQPDKVLFDKAVNDIEHGRFEVARITLNTLINTYDQSEYLAKAKLAIADSWYREGGVHGLAEAEAEYKDFELFYPTMPEAAEAQNRVCMIHYRQMDKADRDAAQALRAEDECRALLVQYPNSKYVPEAQQRLRDIQEALAEAEMRVGTFYHTKGSNPAAANRLARLADQYPLYSRADEALWELGDSYSRMGNRFRKQAGDAYARIVRDYPLSSYTEDAKKKLKDLEMPIPQADPAAYARMKYELEHRTKLSLKNRGMDVLRRGPDMHNAAKSGAPAMTNLRPTVPVSVPVVVEQRQGFEGDVSAQTISGSSDLDKKPDARLSPPLAAAAAGAPQSGPAAEANMTPNERLAQLPSNHTLSEKERKRLAKKYQEQQKRKSQQQAKKQPAQKPAATTAPAAAPAATTTPPSSSSNQ
ncbi:MAG: outer membrane protein assembly factor BamD [Bryobacteraceae bacterium]|jgi:outer membrane protein assembly factor BamD